MVHMKKATRTYTEVLLKVHKDHIIKALAEDSITVGYKKRLQTWTVFISFPADDIEPQEFPLQTFYSEATARKVAKEAKQLLMELYGDYPHSWRF